MATQVIMPRQGQSVESCIISQWYKSPGDKVQKGDILFTYETDKASFETEAETDGYLLTRLFEAGDEVPVLKVVAYIGNKGESIPADHLLQNTGRSAANTEIPGDLPSSPDSSTGRQLTVETPADLQLKISPRARNRAISLGIAFENIKGSGPNGRILDEDVIKAAEKQKSAPSLTISDGGEEITRVSNVRKIIAQKMHESLRNSAQLTHHTSADARAMLRIRNQVKLAQTKGNTANITINDMVCFAVIKALKKHPDANCHFLGDSIKKFKKVHLGIAVDTDRGLMVPTLRNASELSLEGLSSGLRELGDKCRKGNIDPDLLASESASFTVSNLGSYGVELFTPVINLPQVAILGVNTIIQRPADLGDGAFGFIPVIGLSLTYDHRALDGAPASAFLREIKVEIEKLEL
jgi:pyruvate dehydrogenase E2 component (dihydrolipoamide acetyltransferase)